MKNQFEGGDCKSPNYNHKLYDKNGYPIHEGDVLKVFHFVAALRRKKHYMYKIVFNDNGNLRAAHAHKVYKEGLTFSNSYDMRAGAIDKGGYWVHESTEIIEGYHNGIPFDEREKLDYEKT